MSKKNKTKLSTVTIVSISILLIGLTGVLSYISVNSIKYLGKHAIAISRTSTRENTMVLFLEMTRRTAGAYSTYFNAVDDFVEILAVRVKEVLTNSTSHDQATSKRVELSTFGNHDYYTIKDSQEFNCFYFGESPERGFVKKQIESIITLNPLLKRIYEASLTYFVALWIQTKDNVYYEYPRYYGYEKINGSAMKKYFEDLLSEYLREQGDIEKKAVWTKPYRDILGDLNIDAYKFVYDDKGDFLAAVGIDLDFTKIQQTIINNSLFSDRHNSTSNEMRSIYNKMEGFIFIVDDEGSIIAFPGKYSELLSLPGIEYDKLKEYPDKLQVSLKESLNSNIRDIAGEIGKNKIGVRNLDLKGENYIIAYSKIVETGWVLCFATLEKSLMTSIESTKKAIHYTEDRMSVRFIIISLLFLVTFIILAVLFFKYYILKPLHRIRSRAKDIGAGDFDISLKESGFAEISDLSVTVNNLTKELKLYTRNLESEVKQRQSIETELEIAGKLQNSVLPKITDEFVSDKFEIYAKLIPAKEMSGDFYDFFYVNEDTLCIVLADVCGKGITAAFYMSMAKAIIKETCLKAESMDIGKIVEKINNTLNDSVKKKPMFLTMYLVFYNIKTGIITYTNAGHGVYAGVDCIGNVSFHGEAHNSFVGFFGDIEYGSSKVKLKSGEVFALYTDGITEACNKNDDLYGNERLKEIFEANCKQKLPDIGDSIFKDVIKFQSGNQNDDITLVMLKRK
jgi:serine phosphatase RsbU (regulator of sigma subunit)